MKKVIAAFLMCAVYFDTVSAFADTEEKPEWAPDVTAEVAFERKYVWRGQTMVDGTVIQPGASVSKYGFTVSVWGNYDTETLERFTEWNYIFDYTMNIGNVKKIIGADSKEKFVDPLSFSFGYTYYTFPHLDGDSYDSHEIYTGIFYDWIVKPFVTYYIDFDSGDGSYWEFGARYSFVMGRVTVDTAITAGYNAGQWCYDKSFSNILFSGSVTIPVIKHITISPDVNFSLALDDQYDSEFYGGLKIALAF
ncbi:MAG: hypothetical protein A2Z72_09010 [Omnitrophica bacterium RBG_13_46_9]|nr:MAG: hypothetical protein A2Z72_09010 [Omnitrophica bacterium RBG_13_46_9]